MSVTSRLMRVSGVMGIMHNTGLSLVAPNVI